MKVGYLSVAVVLGAACGATGPAKKAANDGSRTGLCSHVRWPGEPSPAWAWEDVVNALGPNAPEREPCAPVEDCREIYVVESPDGMGSRTLVTPAPGGFHLYREAFDAGSGFACEWAPETTTAVVGPWVVVRHSGYGYERTEQECDGLGFFTQIALVGADSGRVEALFICSDSEHAILTTGNADDQLTLSDCGGDTVTFTLAELEACGVP